MKNWTALILVLAAAFGLAIFGTTPPAPVPATANPAEFSAGRAMVDVQIIAKAPHSTGTAENAAVRGHIAARLDALGLQVETTQGPVDRRSVDRLNSWSGLGQPSLTWVNIIGTLPGKDRSLPAVLLMAHHDTVWGSPGAADDTAGVASILEVVRAIQHRGQPARDIMVLITDAEELGLVGARAFFANDPLRKRVGAVINLEARGGGGRTTLFQTSANNGNAVARYRANVNRPAGSSLAAFIYSVLPNDTDLTPALEGDYAAYNFAFIGRSGLYHSPLATPERLDQGALQDMGAQVLALTGALAVAKPLPAAAPDTVFFDVFGLFMITYPVWVGWLLLALGAGGVVLGFRGNSNGPAILGGAGRMFALLIGAGVVLYVLNLISGAGPSANYYDRLAAIPMLEVIAGLGCLAIFILCFGNWKHTFSGIAGAWGVLFIMATSAQFVTPTAAYFIVIPVFLAGLVIVAQTKFPILVSHICAGCVAVLVVGYMLVLGHQMMQGVGPAMPMVVALPLGLAALAVLPLWKPLTPKTLRLGAVLLLGAATLVAVWVKFDPPADTIAVYSDTKN